MKQFNLQLGEQAKIYGMDLVEFNNQGFVFSMRKLARQMIKQCGKITCDDLRIIADKYGIEPDHPNAWGSIFKTKDFIECGFQKSKRISNHARRIIVWTLKDNNRGFC